jgi:hydroxymethylglutaryl-CoA lyase
MQGVRAFIPTELKIAYLNALLLCGFNRLDFGSFVSPKAIPQLRDTAEVMPHLQLSDDTKLLAIVANEKGAEQGLAFNQIDFLGYPFSVSEQFQLRNTHASITESKIRLKNISNLVHDSQKNVMVYLSMGFGNPYGDPWSTSLVLDYALELHETLGIQHFALSDTIGCATPGQLNELFSLAKERLPNVEIGVHLHAAPHNAKKLIIAAIEAGCHNFDSALLGKGGCPMAKDELTGNLNTETLISVCVERNIDLDFDPYHLAVARNMAADIFNTYL